MIGHIGGLPVEEIIASVTGAGAGLLIARARALLRMRHRGRSEP